MAQAPDAVGDVTVYVVAGFPRTGTTVTVRAVDAGGIPALTAPRRVNVRNGHRSQPDSYWQPPKDWWRKNPPGEAAGRVVKFLLFADGATLPPYDSGQYRVVVLTRRQAEVVASVRTAYGTSSPYSERRVIRWAHRIAGRDDVDTVSVLDHRDLMLHPQESLERLSWPLSAPEAAETVDHTWWRFRR